MTLFLDNLVPSSSLSSSHANDDDYTSNEDAAEEVSHQDLEMVAEIHSRNLSSSSGIMSRSSSCSDEITEEDWNAFENMLKFSFSSTVLENSSLVDVLRTVYQAFDRLIQTREFDDLKMKTILAMASKIYGSNIDKINRSREERLCFEAVCLLLFSRRAIGQNLAIEGDQFAEEYPECSIENVGEEEFNALLIFRNFMKMAMHLIPPLHNKNHLLDLVTRLVEGKDARHVTGTGATKATRLRVNIILKEGNLVVPKRPPRLSSTFGTKPKKMNGGSVNKDLDYEHTEKKKRGRKRKDSFAEPVVVVPMIPEPISFNTGIPTTIPQSIAPVPIPEPAMLKKSRVDYSAAVVDLYAVPSQASSVDSATSYLQRFESTATVATEESVNFDMLFPMPNLARSQSAELWLGSLSGADNFAPELLRGSSFFPDVDKFTCF